MKVATVFSVLGFASLSLAGLVPKEEDGHFLEKRCSNYNAVSACQSSCRVRHNVASACRGCNGNPSCMAACESGVRQNLNRCYNCCSASCTMC